MAPKNRSAENHPDGVRQILHSSAGKAQDELIEEALRSPPLGIGRVVDLRIPLVWLLAAVGSFAGFQIMLWSSVQKMTESMVKVEAKLETSSAQTVQALIEVNRVKDRVDRVADDYRTLQQQVVQLQQQRPR